MTIRPTHHRRRVLHWLPVLAGLWPLMGQAQEADLECRDWLAALNALADPAASPYAPFEEIQAGLEATCASEHRYWLSHREAASEADRQHWDPHFMEQASWWAHARAVWLDNCAGALTVLGEVAHAAEALPVAVRQAFAEASHAALVCESRDTDRSAELTLGAIWQTVDGVAGGPDDAATRFGAACTGRIARVADHRIRVEARSQLSALAVAQTRADLSLVVTGPTGTFCADDDYATTPALSIPVAPGVYEIYVGASPDSTGRGRYTFALGSLPLPRFDADATARLGAVPRPEPGAATTVSGRTDGAFDAALLGAGCSGWIGEVPDLALEVPSYGRVTLEAHPDGPRDLSLVVLAADRVHCNDDDETRDPRISVWLDAGRYPVWVGRANPEPTDWRLSISDDDPLGHETGHLTPRFGAGTLSNAAPSVVLAGVAAGGEPASDRFGPHCQGYVQFEPSHTLYLVDGGQVQLELAATHDSGADAIGDLVTIVAGPAGTLCSNDGRTVDPMVPLSLESGTYEIWVGELSGSPRGMSYGLRASLWPLAGDLGPLAPPPSPLAVTPATARHTSWGWTSALVADHGLGPDCVGGFPETPTVALQLDEPAAVRVAAYGGGANDLALVVLDDTGSIFCRDDDEGLDPVLDTRLEAGAYRVHVGQYDSAARPAPFALHVVSGPAPDWRDDVTDAAPTDTQAIEAPPPGGSVQLTGRSGGPNPGRLHGPSCVGHLSERPNVALEVSAAGAYELSIEGSGDTTLVVDGPGGPYCSDDFDGFNPAILALLIPGRYDVYVGSYRPRLAYDYTLRVRTLSDSTATPPAP